MDEDKTIFMASLIMITRNLQMISEYKPCLSSVGETCADKYEIKPRFSNKLTLEECQSKCNEKNECKFAYFFTNKNNNPLNCLRYTGCDETRETAHIGSTYSKDGNCPPSNPFRFLIFICYYAIVVQLDILICDN